MLHLEVLTWCFMRWIVGSLLGLAWVLGEAQTVQIGILLRELVYGA